MRLNDRYEIVYSETAKNDIDDLFFFIVSEYKTYNTAEKYVDGIEQAILSLELYAEIFPLQTNRFFRKYGQYVRRINYKKMAIIYTVHDTTVYIHRIVPAAIVNVL
jgi:plasmid stabilization system protein ParE